MSLLDEFKIFALRGNMVDLAIGVIIGAAFGRVVSSLVADVIMPPLGMLIGGVDFSFLSIPLKAAQGDQPAVLIKYGTFINAIIDFLIISAVIFAVIKLMNRLKGEVPVADPLDKPCPECLMSIPIKARRCGHCGSVLSQA